MAPSVQPALATEQQGSISSIHWTPYGSHTLRLFLNGFHVLEGPTGERRVPTDLLVERTPV